LGPGNFLGRLYQVIPVGITVEGANILTRTMMIFGQGAIRCHPYIQAEMAALQQADQHEFDAVLFKHIRFTLSNLFRSCWYTLTNAAFASVPGDTHRRRYFQQIARLSSAFALSSDIALLTLGGSLKRKERISGRFADVISNLYLCSCVLKHFKDQGSQPADLPLLHWSCQHTLHAAQTALLAIFASLPMRWLGYTLKLALFPFGQTYKAPNDQLDHQLAVLLQQDSAIRDRLTLGIYINQEPHDATGRIEVALKAVLAAAPVEAKLHAAQKSKQLAKGELSTVLEQAFKLNIINQSEVDLMIKAEEARFKAISVDHFDNL